MSSTKKTILSLILVAIPLLVLLVPPSWTGFPDMTWSQQQVLAIFFFAALSWIFELIPSWVTSVSIIFLLTFVAGDKSLFFLRFCPHEGQEPGVLVSNTEMLKCFGDPSVILYIGGLVLALSATNLGLDSILARTILKPFGKKSKFVLLGAMISTGVISMFMSDTATTALMLGVMAPVFISLGDDSKGKAALALGIPFSSLIGGVGTPIGTPPAMLAFKALTDGKGFHIQCGFGTWMAYMVPFCIIMIVIAWFLLLKIFPFKTTEINVDFPKKEVKRKSMWIMAVTYVITVMCWVFGDVLGLSNNEVALIPVVALAMAGIFTADDIGKLPWAVLWMFTGGIALGDAMSAVGLSQMLVTSIPFREIHPMFIIVTSALLTWGLSNFISNTGTAALLIPVMDALALDMKDQFAAFGVNSGIIIFGIAIAASMAMSLPVSTPGNALAMGTGHVTQKQMIKGGFTIGLIGVIIGYAILFI